MLSYNLLPKFILFVCVTNAAGQIIQPCNIDDEPCIAKSANIALKKIADGVPDVGVEVLDPLHVDKIDGDLANLKYTLTDNTIKGFKDCEISNVKLDLDNMKILFDLECSNLRINGDYVINGRLIILPIEGEGTFSIIAKKYFITMDTDIKKVAGKDGKDHLSIKNFKSTLEGRDGLTYDFKNLFHGQKDLSDAVHKFANENWKEVADFVQGPVLNSCLKKIINQVNKYLKTVPYEDLFLH
ncbi:circadian clock-controlled protein daywake-like [Pectinophora gossypiella]|uniref:circadian clock-controlled protein daywake-like n=1 Tax=Pectinophora gossypiella TaxID=13191 RepID=UPI00214E0993|nr:circadian clock-controlled protein daywake-like [Pectinophora gossypiella]